LFCDKRSKYIVFVAHCILNQNSISDGTAIYPGSITEIMELLCSYNVGVVQMPCPELMCLGLDWGNLSEHNLPVAEENTRIRTKMSQKFMASRIQQLVHYIDFQIKEYHKYGFEILGIVGINRSPSCGVDTTSKNNQETEGEGIFIEALRNELKTDMIHIEVVGINPWKPSKAVKVIKKLIEHCPA